MHGLGNITQPVVHNRHVIGQFGKRPYESFKLFQQAQRISISTLRKKRLGCLPGLLDTFHHFT
ncbi:hypothetical protein SF06_28340 [Pseudomonas flexibilis]|nr:hypothetical protein SF06_28340 [Pseudomonas flexibilis]